MRPALWWMLKASVTVVLMWWLLRRDDVRHGLAGIGHAHRGWLAAGLACGGTAFVFHALRWALCLRMTGLRLPFSTLLRLTLIGHGAGLLSVGSLGNDAVRAALAARRLPGGMPRVLGSIAGDHASAFPAFLLIGCVSLTTLRGSVSASAALWIAAGAALLVFFGTGLLLRRFRRDWHDRLWRFLADPETRRWFRRACLASVPALAFYYLTFWCAARAVGIQIGPAAFGGAAAVADVVSSLPITIAGLGVREKTFETLLGQWHGIPAGPAVAMSLTGLALLAVWGIVGAGCFLFGDSHLQAIPASDESGTSVR